MPRKVLVADDSPTIRKIVELCLADANLDVAGARSGAEAIESFKSSRPDLVLADVVMPGPDGYELCDRIKSGDLGASVPVVLLADIFVPFDERRALGARADGHLAKPFEASTLLAVVKDLLGAESASAARHDETELLLEDTVPQGSRDAGGAAGTSRAAGSGRRGSRSEASAPGRTISIPAKGGGSPAELRMNPAEVDAVARRVVEMLSADIVREVAWEVVPEMSELLIRERLQNVNR